MPDMNENAETQQEYFGKAKEGKVVEHFEAYGQCRDSRRIAELEKENARLVTNEKSLLAERKIIVKENAELKERVENQKSFLERIRAKFELGEIDRKEIEGYLESEQLTKARELLRKWVELFKPKLEGYPITPIQEQTEQFLNSEMEK